MDNEVLEIIKSMKESITRLESNIDKLEQGQQEIKTDIKDIKVDVGSIKINIKETIEDTRSSELATAQNSFEIAQIKMKMKMA